VFDRIPGPDRPEALELIYHWARRSEGIVVLSRPTARSTVAAVLGALRSGSRHGPARVYLADPSRERLMLLFAEVSKINLATDVTLYHGSLTQFFRDLPFGAELICTDFATLDPGRSSTLRSNVPSGTLILSLNTASADADTAAAQYLIDSGIFELEADSAGGAVYRTTQRCHGARFVPRAGLRVALQGSLHERYFLPETAAHTSHTPVSDLTENIRREFSREFPAASGSGSWPYAAPESGGLPPTLPSGKPWPKISIVTPTLNQGKYIEETILSVLHQDYPNVEHIIVDGASTDETPSILERYRDKLALVISEPDNGQSDAINKGMSKAAGDILTWLNGDDMLAPGALAAVALALDINGADMIAGVCQFYREGRLETQHLTACPDGPLPLEDLLDLAHGWLAGQFFIQPEVMFTRAIWRRAGGHVDEQLHYILDYELWLRFARAGARLHVIGRPLSWFRLHEEQKTHASSSVRRELVACRDAFLKENDLTLKSKALVAPWREQLRIALLDGIARARLAHALAWAGHEVSLVNILDSEGLLDRVMASRPDLVIVGNLPEVNADPALVRKLTKRFPTLVNDPSIEVFRPSLPLDIFRPRNKQACREHFSLPLDRFLILLPASLDEARNRASALLEALARLKLPGVSVVTSGWTAANVSSPVELIQLGDINGQHKVALLYSAVDVVVASHPTEPFGPVHIAAIACGTPVAGYPDAAFPEAIRAGVTGAIASDDNPTSLAAAIHDLYVHPELRKDLARWGRLYAENEWSEFSTYRHIFLALHRLGLAKSLNLRRRIAFLPDVPQVPVDSR
jgi:glycosyltransferase involved in cell wall biosynthesis